MGCIQKPILEDACVCAPDVNVSHKHMHLLKSVSENIPLSPKCLKPIGYTLSGASVHTAFDDCKQTDCVLPKPWTRTCPKSLHVCNGRCKWCASL